MIKPVHAKYFMSDEELAKEQLHHPTETLDVNHDTTTKATPIIWVVLAWVAVGIPMLWGMYRTILSVKAFF